MIVNANSIIQHVYNPNQKWNDKTCQCECRNYRKYKKYYSWKRSTCIFENVKYLKIIGDDCV